MWKWCVALAHRVKCEAWRDEMMKMIVESERLEDYLSELEEVDFSHSLIQTLVNELFHSSQTELEKIQIAYEYVRDHISHSWDIQSKRVTCRASDVLKYKEGICYAKTHLLVAILRSQGIPTGFCYQRLILFDTPEEGYCIHALNAVYVQSLKRWVRLDARGNKEGIDAQFSVDEERLAFRVQPELNEKDYPLIFVKPHPKTLAVLNEHTDLLVLYKYHLPTDL